MGPKGRKRNWGKCPGIPSPGLPVHTPIPNSQGLHLSSLLCLFHLSSQAPSHFSSNPLPSRSFFPQQPSPLSALPDPISSIPSSTSLSSPSSHLLPPPSRPHLGGVGGLGGWPPPQPGCGSGGGGWLSLPRSGCRCQGGDRIWGCPIPGRCRGGEIGRLGP